MVVYWDHGNGWLGYGADATCSSAGPYNDHYYCSIASLARLTQGELAPDWLLECGTLSCT